MFCGWSILFVCAAFLLLDLIEEGADRNVEANEERALTSSTSVMSESDLEYGGNAVKAESIDSNKVETSGEPEETETESTMPLLTPGVDSPKIKPEFNGSFGFQ